MTCCFVALAALVLMGVGFGFILFFQQRRHRRQLKSTHSIPETLSTGITLDNLEQRFQQAVGSNLLGRRLARL